MGTNKVDILFVLDASDSMKPCFDKLKQNLRQFIVTLNQASFEVRLGLLAYHSMTVGWSIGHEHFVLSGDEVEKITNLYHPGIKEDDYFTSDLERFLRTLDTVKIEGDECTPLALDIASDFPFAPPDESRRVIILFSNEKIETGMEVNAGDVNGKSLESFPRVLQKIAKKKIALYAYIPASNAAAQMMRLPKSIIHSIDEGGDCWNKIDFAQVLEKMGQSISASSLQMTREPECEKAIYGQDKWVTLHGERDTRDRT